MRVVNREISFSFPSPLFFIAHKYRIVDNLKNHICQIDVFFIVLRRINQCIYIINFGSEFKSLSSLKCNLQL